MSFKKIDDMKKFEDALLNIIKFSNGQSLDQLIQIVKEEYSLDKDLIIKILKDLRKRGKIELEEPIHIKIPPQSLKKFIIHSMNYDLWLSILLVLVTIPIALFIPENALESGNMFFIFLGVIRLIIGTIFIVFLPGYAIVTILWPTSEKDDLTRYGISFGLSLVIAPIIGLVLNFTPFGISFISVLITVSSFTLITLCIAFFRRFQEINKKNLEYEWETIIFIR